MPANNRPPNQSAAKRRDRFATEPNVSLRAAPLTLLGVLILIMALSGCASSSPPQDDPWKGYPGVLPQFE